MNVMFDINVILDIVGHRQPFYESSRDAFLRVVGEGDVPYLSVHALATLYYLLGATATRKQRAAAMEWVFEAFKVAGLTAEEVAAARGLAMSDFEDALVVAAARAMRCCCILTRNVRDFKESPIRAIAPDDFVCRCG